VRADRAHRHQAESQPPGDGQAALILPTLGRTEIDLQNGVPQGVTVEDSMSMVHLSYGMNKPASDNLLSETAIVARLAHATLGSGKVDWLAPPPTTPHPRHDRASVRRLPRLQRARGASGRLPPARGLARTRMAHASGRAQFVPHAVDLDTPIHRARAKHGERLMVLMTARSHDQYNTTIYGLDDRYRGVFGLRRVVFINKEDLAMLGLKDGEYVDWSASGTTTSRAAPSASCWWNTTSRAAAWAPTSRRPTAWCRCTAPPTAPARRPPNPSRCCWSAPEHCYIRCIRRSRPGGRSSPA
jgi:anaerobic selenocysteine-containing dehydrogenase